MDPEYEVLKKPRGFAALSRDRLRQISSKGGKTAHANGSAHVFTKEKARIAALKRHGMEPMRDAPAEQE